MTHSDEDLVKVLLFFGRGGEGRERNFLLGLINTHKSRASTSVLILHGLLSTNVCVYYCDY